MPFPASVVGGPVDLLAAPSVRNGDREAAGQPLGAGLVGDRVLGADAVDSDAERVTESGGGDHPDPQPRVRPGSGPARRREVVSLDAGGESPAPSPMAGSSSSPWRLASTWWVCARTGGRAVVDGGGDGGGSGVEREQQHRLSLPTGSASVLVMALPPDPLILPADQAGLVDLLTVAARAYAGDSAEERGAWFDAMIMLDWAPALSLLLNLVDHADPGIRREVASHLPWADRDADADSASVAALVLLTHDPVALVRDWAATGLGFLDDADSPAVRGGAASPARRAGQRGCLPRR